MCVFVDLRTYVPMYLCMYVQVIKALNDRIGEETTKNTALRQVYEERIAELQAKVCLCACGGCEAIFLFAFRTTHIIP